MVKANIIEETDKLIKGERTINPAYKNKEVADAIAEQQRLEAINNRAKQQTRFCCWSNANSI